MNVLILGSNSFIAASLVKLLSKNNNINITVFGRSVRGLKVSNAKYIIGDYQDLDSLSSALKNQDIVYHFISKSYPFSSWHNPSLEIHDNILPFINFINLCQTNNIKKIVFTSSGGTVYGLNDQLCNEFTVAKPYSPYGISKLYIENFLEYARKRNDITYDIYRVSNAYGEGQDVKTGNGFICACINNILNNKPVVVYGNAKTIRDYIHVDDVCNLLALSVTKPIETFDIYNVCSNNSVSLQDILTVMRDDLGILFDVNNIPARESDNPAVFLDNKKILTFFQDYKFISLKDGINRMYTFNKDNNL